MTVWGAPAWLWLLWLLPLGGAIAVWRLAEAHKQQRLFASGVLWRRMRVRSDGLERAVRQGLILLAAALVAISLADPRARGPQVDPSGPGRLLVLLDVSKSMAATDALSSQRRIVSRFEAATGLMADLLTFLSNWSVGLVVFARDPLVLCPTTDDSQAVLTLLERARPGDPAMRQGTDIEQALTAGAALLGTKPGAMLLLSDGEELTGEAHRAIGLLRARHIPVYAVGLGSAGGTPLVEPDGNPMRWRDQPVVSARHDDLLQALARGTGGRYFASTRAVSVDGMDATAPPTAVDVASLLRGPAAAVPQGRSKRNGPLAAALCLLLADAVIAWRLRPRGSPGKGLRGEVVKAGLWPILAALLLGWTWPSWTLTRQAVEAARQGHARVGTELLERAARSDPANAVVRFDLANSLERAGHRAHAASEYQLALTHLPVGGALAEHAWYNLGDTRFEQGDPQAAARCFRKALAIDAKDADAAHNLALCLRRLHPQTARQAGASTSAHGGGQAGAGAGPPPPADADRLLAALAEDERAREASAAQRAVQSAASEDPSQVARQMLQEAGRSLGLPGDRDW